MLSAQELTPTEVIDNSERLMKLVKENYLIKTELILHCYEQAYKIHQRVHPQSPDAEHEDFARYAMSLIGGSS